jgi:hypothetical protein
MMMRSILIGLGLFLAVSQGSAQANVEFNTASLFERYSFDSGLTYSEVTEVTLPFVLTTPLRRGSSLTLSGGFTRVSVTTPQGKTLPEQSVSGLVDTEARLVVAVVPDRFNLLLTAVAPTGMEALEVDDQAVLTALSSQVIDFSVTSLGTGGKAGGGFAGAFPVGNMALGFAGSYTYSMAYSPVVGETSEWKPGGELRIRAGLEGSVGPRTYLRVAGIFGSRQKDQIEGEELGGLGNQYHFYVSLNHGLGSTALTLYGVDSYRSAPQIESTPVGAVRLPKGNLLALGARIEIPVARQTRLVPLVEFRRLTEAPRDGTGGGSMEAAGSTFRVGADVRHPLNDRWAIVAEGSGLFGNVGVGDGTTAGVNGFRAGVHLELRR